MEDPEVGVALLQDPEMVPLVEALLHHKRKRHVVRNHVGVENAKSAERAAKETEPEPKKGAGPDLAKDSLVCSGALLRHHLITEDQLLLGWLRCSLPSVVS